MRDIFVRETKSNSWVRKRDTRRSLQLLIPCKVFPEILEAAGPLNYAQQCNVHGWNAYAPRQCRQANRMLGSVV